MISSENLPPLIFKLVESLMPYSYENKWKNFYTKYFAHHCIIWTMHTELFYYTMIHKKSKNLKNGHFQNQNSFNWNKICKILTHGGMVCSCVLNRNTLKNLVFYSKVNIKFVKQVSKKSSICVGFHHQWQFLFNADLFLHHKACFEAKTQNLCLDFLYTHASVCFGEITGP